MNPDIDPRFRSFSCCTTLRIVPSFLLAVPLMNIVSIPVSPSLRSRSAWLLELAHAQLESTSHERHSSVVRELPASALAVGREVIALVKSTEVSIAAR